ncbi:MAG: DNA polymerase I [Verrucomicrobia bacterium]|nr:DNA polymerase I [Verrucomicrobiota bacterium]MBS0637041.1 DNA polymerase I [Verrucomicrobiota bacterium]
MSDAIYIIDASGFIYRAFFAIQGLSSRQGEATGALYGYIRSYLRLIEQYNPAYVVAVFDAPGGKDSRVAIYKEYKAHRKPTPNELIDQIGLAQEYCTLAGVPTLAAPGVEADDTIGSVALWAKKMGLDVFICTGDKDMAQLVDDKIKIINLHKDNLLIDAEKAKELYGVAPRQMRDYLAIVGDTSDNVPGISGFGPKSAIQLLEEYKTLDNILANADKIGGKKGATLASEKEIALISQKLVTIDTSVPFEQNLDFFKLKEADKPKLWQFLQSKNFTSLMDMADLQPVETANYHTIKSLDELDQLIAKLSREKTVCIDTETTGTNPHLASLVGVGLAADDKDAYYIPFNSSMARRELKERLAPLLANPAIGFYGHNIKYDMHVLNRAALPIAHIAGDTIISSYLLNAHQRRHSLDDLAMLYFGKKKIDISELIGKGKSQITMDQVDIEKVSTYCCEDVIYTVKLKEVLDKEIAERKLESVLELEIALIKVLQRMEATGIYIDKNVLRKLSQEVGKQIEALQEHIYVLAGGPFNLNSPKQLAEVLFEKLAIRPPKKGKTQPSTNADVLETLSYEYPIAAKIMEYRSLEKLRSTYLETLPEEINPETGRIHCTFNQFVTATGRLSSQDPNLQNIPVRSELGLKIRSSFQPQEPGWSFLAADYSQIELRILAHVCEDEGLLEAFRNNLDVHAYTASQIFHVPLEAVTEEMRHQAKAVNFGIVYGQQAFGLAQTLRIPVSSAQSFIDAYFRRYKGIKDYIENAKEMARKTGKAVSLTGRERLLPEINSSNQMLKTAAERLAINTPFQATAADIIKMAMVNLDKWLIEHKSPARMLLQIHDELVLEMPDSEIPTISEQVKKHMEGVFALKVPLIVKINVGKNWMEC